MMTEKKTAPHILLVEDDTFLSGIYKTKFEMEGFKVTVADNGEAGLHAVEKKHPDIVLLDVLLPKMDGFSVLSAIKADKQMADTPVILLTNLGTKADVDKGFALGASEYLIKAHATPTEVIAKVKHILHLT